MEGGRLAWMTGSCAAARLGVSDVLESRGDQWTRWQLPVPAEIQLKFNHSTEIQPFRLRRRLMQPAR